MDKELNKKLKRCCHLKEKSNKKDLSEKEEEELILLINLLNFDDFDHFKNKIFLMYKFNFKDNLFEIIGLVNYFIKDKYNRVNEKRKALIFLKTIIEEELNLIREFN